MDIQSVILNGRLTSDVEISYTKNGTPVGKLKFAVNRRDKVDGEWEDVCDFFEGYRYGRMVEVLRDRLVKGQQLTIKGELRQDRWIDKEGKKRSKIMIIIHQIQLTGRPAARKEEEKR